MEWFDFCSFSYGIYCVLYIFHIQILRCSYGDHMHNIGHDDGNVEPLRLASYSPFVIPDFRMVVLLQVRYIVHWACCHWLHIANIRQNSKRRREKWLRIVFNIFREWCKTWIQWQCIADEQVQRFVNEFDGPWFRIVVFEWLFHDGFFDR